MTRREIRDSAFKLVFEQLLRDDDIQELYDIADEIIVIVVAEIDRLHTVFSLGDLIALKFSIFPYHLTDIHLVVNNQNMCHNYLR